MSRNLNLIGSRRLLLAQSPKSRPPYTDFARTAALPVGAWQIALAASAPAEIKNQPVAAAHRLRLDSRSDSLSLQKDGGTRPEFVSLLARRLSGVQNTANAAFHS
jgi:hypothetical protein